MAEQEEASGAPSEPILPDTSAAAVAVALSGANVATGLPPEAAAFLKEQTDLVRLQKENLDADRALQHRHLALRFFGDRLRIGLQLLAIAVGLFVVVGLGAMLWQAHEDHSLVVEAFSVPPDMAKDGLTGQVVAARVLDKLKAMQAATVSVTSCWVGQMSRR